MKNFDYESDWKEYVFPDSESEFASAADIRRLFKYVDLDTKDDAPGGIPLLCDGKTAYVNDEVEHTVIFGESGSGKSWSLIFPLIASLGNGQSSMFVTDIKGELSENPSIRGLLKAKGYECAYLDFRKFDKDCYNILEYPFSLYKRGDTDKAMATAVSFVHTLMAPYEGTKADPFWQLSAEQFAIPLIQMLFDICSSNESYSKYINVLSLASFCNEKGVEVLEHMLREYVEENSNATEMLRSVLANPERTRSCILSTVSSSLRDFLIQESLLRMLSCSSFDVRSMYKKKTCVFLILPDETSAYNSISALMIDYFYNQLIDEYSLYYQNEKPKHDIAWVLDEFCNLRINGMESKISASRGRMMRWFLVCQSKQQLEAVYERSAATILGNCKNIFFLQSSDPEMLKYISEMLGSTRITHSGSPEPLMTVESLRHLPRTPQYRQGIYIRGDLKFKVNLLGFDKYDYLKKYADTDCGICSAEKTTPFAYTPEMLLNDLCNESIPIPFSKNASHKKTSAAQTKKNLTRRVV